MQEQRPYALVMRGSSRTAPAETRASSVKAVTARRPVAPASAMLPQPRCRLGTRRLVATTGYNGP
jgi:hypothetical protein